MAPPETDFSAWSSPQQHSMPSCRSRACTSSPEAPSKDSNASVQNSQHPPPPTSKTLSEPESRKYAATWRRKRTLALVILMGMAITVAVVLVKVSSRMQKHFYV